MVLACAALAIRRIFASVCRNSADSCSQRDRGRGILTPNETPNISAIRIGDSLGTFPDGRGAA
jgi:hypothetical protein